MFRFLVKLFHFRLFATFTTFASALVSYQSICLSAFVVRFVLFETLPWCQENLYRRSINFIWNFQQNANSLMFLSHGNSLQHIFAVKRHRIHWKSFPSETKIDLVLKNHTARSEEFFRERERKCKDFPEWWKSVFLPWSSRTPNRCSLISRKETLWWG